jgi:UDP-2,4-diacetamido-2,4,6-trideoxy-beta-L-altropyranose hydrolase
MVKKIILRADGDSEIGLGHLYRILAIAEFYKEEYELTILTKESSITSIIPEEFNKVLIPIKIKIKDEPKWIFERFSSIKNILIIDGYQFLEFYQRSIKKLGFTFIYIDDLAEEFMCADVVVNHSPYFTEIDFKSEDYTRFALGLSYSMLRPSFNNSAKKEKKKEVIHSAFICFGGADPNNLSFSAAKALLNIGLFKNINIVLGEANEHLEIYKLESENSSINLYKNLDEIKLCKLMESCQIAIVPSSTILYEVCSVKMPVLSGYYVPNQEYIYKSFYSKGMIIPGGDFSEYSVLNFEEKINYFLQNNKSDFYISNQNEFFKGFSKLNFLSLLNKLNISFRAIKGDDALMVYQWSNEYLVRINSFNSSPIKFNSHKKWFDSKIDNVNVLFLLALVNNNSAGVVRYEIEDRKAVVGIMVSEKYRGQKLASEFLRESSKLYFKKYDLPIFAYIKKENIASIKSFEKANYIYVKEEMILESISFVYKLEKKYVTE